MVINKTKKMTNPEFVFIKDSKLKHIYHKIYISEICFITGNGDYVSISTKENRYIVHGTICSWEERLKLWGAGFYRIHRSHIIQANAIDTIEGNCVVINKESLPISDSYRKDFYSKFTFL